jgi:hypothetical protein
MVALSCAPDLHPVKEKNSTIERTSKYLPVFNGKFSALI